MGYPWSADQKLTAADLNAAIAYAAGGGQTYTFNIVATGTIQSNAAALPSGVNHVLTTPPESGVILDVLLKQQQVFNDGANDLNVYPPVGAQIGARLVNIPAQIPAAGSGTFLQIGTDQWSGF